MGMAKGEVVGMVRPVEEKDQQKVVGKRGRNRSREKVWSEYMTRRPTTTDPALPCIDRGADGDRAP
jgi:uncharacterized protein YifE (UPF0438 family)